MSFCLEIAPAINGFFVNFAGMGNSPGRRRRDLEAGGCGGPLNQNRKSASSPSHSFFCFFFGIHLDFNFFCPKISVFTSINTSLPSLYFSYVPAQEFVNILVLFYIYHLMPVETFISIRKSEQGRL